MEKAFEFIENSLNNQVKTENLLEGRNTLSEMLQKDLSCCRSTVNNYQIELKKLLDGDNTNLTQLYHKLKSDYKSLEIEKSKLLDANKELRTQFSTLQEDAARKFDEEKAVFEEKLAKDQSELMEAYGELHLIQTANRFELEEFKQKLSKSEAKLAETYSKNSFLNQELRSLKNENFTYKTSSEKEIRHLKRRIESLEQFKNKHKTCRVDDEQNTSLKLANYSMDALDLSINEESKKIEETEKDCVNKKKVLNTLDQYRSTSSASSTKSCDFIETPKVFKATRKISQYKESLVFSQENFNVPVNKVVGKRRKLYDLSDHSCLTEASE